MLQEQPRPVHSQTQTKTPLDSQNPRASNTGTHRHVQAETPATDNEAHTTQYRDAQRWRSWSTRRASSEALIELIVPGHTRDPSTCRKEHKKAPRPF